MKNNTTTLHDCKLESIRFGGCGNSEAMVWKLGLDIELRAVAVAMQCGRGVIGPAAKWSREQLLQWVKEKRARGEAVHTVYESCGFGYTLHEQLSAAGANSLVSTPMRLKPGAQKEERPDRCARVVCAIEPLSGWSKPRAASDSHSLSLRATTTGTGAAAGVLEKRGASVGKPRASATHRA